jgi:dihydroorotase (multifunctional complex type)
MRTFVGGSVVTVDGVVEAHVVVDGEKVVALTNDPPSGEQVDVDGLLLFPGMIDTHVHLMDPGPTEREDFPTGTGAAAARGATTIIEHTHGHPVREVGDLSAKLGHLAGRSNVDFGLAAHVWPDRIGDLASLWTAGVSFFKIFTCSTHGVPGLDAAQLLEAFEAIASVDGRTLVHCEDESLTAAAERILRSQGRSDPGILTKWRSREAELVAVASAAVLVESTGVRATFAHVSSADVIDVIDAARKRGADIAAEACPQYFAIDEDEVLEHGALRKFTPPARVRNDADRDRMWEAVRSGAFSHFSTDHAPSTIPQKAAGDFWDAPFGLPGLDTTFPFLVDAALGGRIELSDVAHLASAAPADRYGLAPLKGAIRVGGDADIVLVDPADSWRVSDEDILSKAGWSPYSGRTFKGRIVATYLRGQEIARDGRPHREHSGRFVPGPGGRPG